jgi:hypothetical protein
LFIDREILGVGSNILLSLPDCRTTISLFCRTSLIFYTAPVVRFLGKNIHFALFILLYTYVGITLQPNSYNWEEGVMHGWIISLFLMEIRQLSENGWNR